MARPKTLINNPICACCSTNHCIDHRNTLCESCKKFLYGKLKINSEYIAHALSHTDVNAYNKGLRIKTGNCSFCNSAGIIIYRHTKNKKIYKLCQEHHDKWLRIGCELGEFANML